MLVGEGFPNASGGHPKLLWRTHFIQEQGEIDQKA
jgi:hypothetical protein